MTVASMAFAQPATLRSSLVAPFQTGRAAASRAASSGRLSVVAMSTIAPPAKIEVKTLSGETASTEQLALKVADDHVAKGLVHRYVVLVQQNKRRGTASTKTRAEVRGGGRKPIPQKGSGGARQGSTTSPLFPGGGVVFGPKPKDWSISMNKKERRLAMATALQSAAPAMTVVEDLKGRFEGKTKQLVTALQGLEADPMVDNVLLILNSPDDAILRAGKNVEKLQIACADHLNVYNILRADRIIVEASGLKFIQEFYGAEAQEAGDASGSATEAAAPAVEDAPGAEASAPAAEEAAAVEADPQ